MENKRTKICRTCLSNAPPFLPLFSEENYPEKIRILSDVNVTQEQNDFSMVICKLCVENLTHFISFRMKIQESNKFFTNLKQELTFDILAVNISDDCSTSIAEVKLECKLNEARQEGEINDEYCEDDLNENYCEDEVNEDNCEDVVNDDNYEDEVNKVICEVELSEDNYNSAHQEEIAGLSRLKSNENKSEQHPNAEVMFPRQNSRKKRRKVYLKEIINSAIPENSIYRCEKCKLYSTESRYRLYKHLVYKVCEAGGPVKKPELPDGLYSCEECQFITDVKSYMTVHVNTHCPDKKLRAPYVNRVKIPCKVCGTLVGRDNISNHMKRHAERVNCPICHKSYASNSLRTHLKMHNRKDCICEFCGKVFEYEGMYTIHLRIHQEKKLYKCSICGVCVRDKKKHLQTHTGERPHTCDVCGKGLSSGYALKTHMRLHTDERPYKCTMCDSAFRMMVSLNNHMKSKHKLV